MKKLSLLVAVLIILTIAVAGFALLEGKQAGMNSKAK